MSFKTYHHNITFRLSKYNKETKVANGATVFDLTKGVNICWFPSFERAENVTRYLNDYENGIFDTK